MEPQAQAVASEAKPAAQVASGVPSFRLYSIWQIGVAACLCFVAGPLLLARSYKRLGHVRRAWLIVALGVAFFIGNLALVLYKPNGRAAGWIVPIGAFIGLVRKPYGEVYRAHVSAGGAREAWWKPVLFAAALAVTVGPLVVVLGNRYLGLPLP
jgi:hypothetical protein